MNDSGGPINPAMRLLAAGIPLSLLIDLVSPFGPDSRGIIAHERSLRVPAGAAPGRLSPS
jgi:hypothetical protein